MASGSKKVIYAAMIGNSLISATKFFAATYTDSSTMFSEGIHSLVDTGNQELLLTDWVEKNQQIKTTRLDTALNCISGLSLLQS